MAALQTQKACSLRAQEARRQRDEWEDAIADFIRTREDDGVQIADIAASFHIEFKKLDRITQNRISRILRRLGWVTQLVRRNGWPVRVWKPSVIKDVY